MIWLIIMGVLIVLFVLSVILFDGNLSGICIFLAAVCFVIGMWGPITGYDEPAIQEEYELIPIFEESNIYVIETEKGTKIYKCKEKNEHDKSIEQVVIKEIGAGAQIEYAKEYSQPVLRKYMKKRTDSVWNGLFYEKESYYVLFTSEENVIK